MLSCNSFEKHPKIPNCWVWRARADDIIVFLNGEKTNPISMEQHIVTRNKDIAAALVVGMQKFQAALLVEPVPNLGELSPDEAASFVEKIWPSIEEANRVSPAHARVEKSLILLTKPGKPMIRSGKGTIQRQGTVAQYTSEINDIYSRLDSNLSGVERASVDIKDPRQVSQFLHHAISSINPELLQEGAENFFAMGMDSLMAIRLIRALRYGFGQSDLSVSVVNNNPSMQQLVHYFCDAQKLSEHDSLQRKAMKEFLDEYEQSIRRISVEKLTESTNGEVAVLTGSTGSLGTHLLEALLANPGIAHVHCLNRGKNAYAIHKAKAKTTNFPFGQHSHRVSFHYATLDQPNLGLDAANYQQLQITTTFVIHNAWPVNFILPFEAFRPQFEGLLNLFRFASTRPSPPKLLYISSISSVAQYSRFTNLPIIPEEVIRDFDASYTMGYGRSKLISELVCDTAANDLGIPIYFARVGQIAGPVIGLTPRSWSPAEWLPSLIITSISLGVIPADL